MTNINHPYKMDDKKVAHSGATNLRVSTKNSVEISRFIKGLGVDSAVDYLTAVTKKKKAVPYKRFIRDQAHRKGGIGPGRYPVNAAIEFLKLLKNAKNNAEVKGLDVERLVVDNAQANIGGSRFHRGARSFGRRYSKSTNVSITVKEIKAKKVAVTVAKPKVVKKETVVETEKVDVKTDVNDDAKEDIKK